MKALVYHGPGRKAWEAKPRPEIARPTDAAVRIVTTTRLVDTVTTPMLLKMLAAGTLDPRPLATHRFQLDDIMRAYDTFANAAKEKALKVILAAR